MYIKELVQVACYVQRGYDIASFVRPQDINLAELTSKDCTTFTVLE